MDNEHAIEIMKAYRDRLTSSCSNQLDSDIEAFNLAIKALEEKPQGEGLTAWEQVCRIAQSCGYSGAEVGKGSSE